jgi:predicted nucleic acid-binding protein
VIVVDVNVLAYLLIEGEHSAKASALLEREPEWVAPPLWRDELINVLCTYERLGKAERAENLQRLALAEQTLAKTYEVPAETIFSVAAKTGCSGYDSQYLALAMELGVPLFTFDKKILTSSPQTAKRP